MDKFLFQHAQRYDFSHGEAGEILGGVFKLLVRNRFLPQADSFVLQPRDYRLRVLQCMRVLMRDPVHQGVFIEMGGLAELIGVFSELQEEHFADEHGEFASEMLVETLSILKRFAALPKRDDERRAHKTNRRHGACRGRDFYVITR